MDACEREMSSSLEGYHDTESAVKITKDKNGVDLITLQSPGGFSTKVIVYFLHLSTFFVFSSHQTIIP